MSATTRLPIKSIQEFIKSTRNNLGKPLIAMDYGRKNIGIAISDGSHQISRPLGVIDAQQSLNGSFISADIHEN